MKPAWALQRIGDEVAAFLRVGEAAGRAVCEPVLRRSPRRSCCRASAWPWRFVCSASVSKRPGQHGVDRDVVRDELAHDRGDGAGQAPAAPHGCGAKSTCGNLMKLTRDVDDAAEPALGTCPARRAGSARSDEKKCASNQRSQSSRVKRAEVAGRLAYAGIGDEDVRRRGRRRAAAARPRAVVTSAATAWHPSARSRARISRRRRLQRLRRARDDRQLDAFARERKRGRAGRAPCCRRRRARGVRRCSDPSA